MDVFIRNALSGEEGVLEVESDLSVTALHGHICQLLGLGSVDLSIDGDAFDSADTGRISEIPGMAPGCCVTAMPNGECYINPLRTGTMKLCQLPVWAQRQPRCALAVLKRLKHRRPGGDRDPHLMPSLWGEYDVLVAAMHVHRTHFYRAPAELRNTKRLAVSAVKLGLYHRYCDALRADVDVVRAALHTPAGPSVMDLDDAVRCRRDIARHHIQHAPAELRADKAFVIEVLSLGQPVSLLDIAPSLRCDTEVLRTALTELRFLQEACPLEQLDVCWALEACSSSDTMLDMGRVNPACLQHAAPQLMADKAFVLKALELDGSLYSGVHPALQHDYDVALAAGGHCTHPTWLADKGFVLAMLGVSGPSVLYSASRKLQGDKDVVLPAVRQNSDVFECVSPEMQADRDVALAAVRGGLCLGDVKHPARCDRQVVLEAVHHNPQNIRFACDALRDDKEIALAAVSCGCAEFFPWLGDRVRDDCDVALEAVRRSGKNFTFAGESVRGDKEVLLAAGSFAALHQDVDLTDVAALVEAVAKDATLLHRVGPTLRNHKPLALAAVKRSPLLYHRLGASMRSDPDVAKAGLALGTHLQYMDDAVRGNMDVVRAAVTQDGAAFRYASEALRADEDLALCAVKAAPGMLRYASEELRGHRKIVDWALHMSTAHALHEDQFRFTSTAIRGNRELMLDHVRSHPHRALHATPELLEDREFVLKSVAGLDRLAMQRWLGDRNFVMKAMQSKGNGMSVFRWASPELRSDVEVVVLALRINKLNFAAATEVARRHPRVLSAAVGADVPASLLMSYVGNDPQLLCSLVRKSADSFVHASSSMKNDRKLVLSVVASSPDCFAYAGDSVRNRRSAVRAALRAGVKLSQVGDTLRGDKAIVLVAMRHNPRSILFVCDALRDDKDIALAAVSCGDAPTFPWLGDRMRDDRDVALEAVRRNGNNFTFAGEGVRDDKEVLLLALRSRGTVLLHCASPRLQSDADVVRAAVASHRDNESFALRPFATRGTN